MVDFTSSQQQHAGACFTERPETPEKAMKLLNRLPGSRREPHGLEWRVLRRMPSVLLAGTVIPALLALANRWFVSGDSAIAIAKQVQMIDYLAIGIVFFHWTLVLTVSIFCVIIMLMKGPAYVADAYELPDSPEPKD